MIDFILNLFKKKASVESPLFTIHLTKSDRILYWYPSSLTILEVAIENNIDLTHGCKEGVCHTCICTLQEGEIDYDPEPLTESPSSNKVLICCAQPKSNIKLEL